MLSMQTRIGCIYRTYQVLPLMACSNRCKVTLTAFVRFFSTMSFQMFLQTVCCYWRKLALFAFVRFLARVNFHVCSQIACLNCGIATLVTFVWFLSTVCFEMYPQMGSVDRCILALTAFIGFFPGMIFSNVSPNFLPELMQSHIDCICRIFLLLVFPCQLFRFQRRNCSCWW